MNTKSNSIRKKTFIYLLSYSAIILLLLWLFQIVFLKIFFERYQYNKIIEVASKISENNLENLEEEIYNNDMCAEVYYGDKIYGYNTQNKDCILNSNNTKIINAKNKIITGTSKKSLIKIIDPRYDSKSIIYGLKLNDNIYIILNTKLEDVNSTTNVLSGQLIYITFIVIILSGIMSILVSDMLNKPILKITSKAKEMAKGNYEPDEEVYNIKELDELTTTLNYAKSEIKNTDELRKDLMANVSHDLKTPLTMIKAYAEMARDLNKDNEEKRTDNLNVIIEESDRLNSLVNNILELSKSEKNMDTLTRENFSINELITKVLHRFDYLTEEGYTLKFVSKKEYIIYADIQKIEQVIYNLVILLEKNKDTYNDNLPISIEPYKFKQDDEETQKAWKKEYGIDENATAEEAFETLKEKYGINEENIQKARKIMTVRYEISRNGYSNIKPVIISKSISYLSANQIKEQSSSFPGTSVVTTPIVTYPYGSLASHILGYVGSISSEEYNANKEKYDINDIIGKTGIQYTLEEYLKGEDGIRQVDMSVDGTITEQHIAEEAEAGHTVTLTIDSNLQKVTEEALKKNIKDIANGSYGQKYNAKAGAAVVMDVKSGEILALASYPDYEPELFISGITQKKLEEYNKGNNYYNRAISGTYAPRFSI